MRQGSGVDVATEDILCPGGMPAFLALPEETEGRLPIVVLMHERYGLVQHTRDLAVKCAADGFLTIAPNFFFKHPDQAALNAGEGRYELGDVESSGYLRQTLAMLSNHPAADMTRIAVAGYCQTGRHPLVFAADENITAAVVWYGAASPREWAVTPTQPRSLADILSKVRCPVFGAFGALDHIISIDDVRCSATRSKTPARAMISASMSRLPTAGSTTRCRGAIARPKPKPDGRRSRRS